MRKLLWLTAWALFAWLITGWAAYAQCPGGYCPRPVSPRPAVTYYTPAPVPVYQWWLIQGRWYLVRVR